MKPNSFSEHVLLGNHAVIEPVHDKEISTPLYAINWFNSNFKWLYHFYNFLAAPRVFKIGGKVVFKGETGNLLSGTSKGHRDIALIVQYPSPAQFLKLFKDKLFLLVSVFRGLSVSKFSFCFTQRIDSIKPQENLRNNFDRSKSYAIHHFRTNQPLAGLYFKLNGLSKSQDITIYFAGQLSALLLLKNKTKTENQMSCPLDGVFIYETDREEIFESFVQSASFKEIEKTLDSSFMAHIKRTL